MQISLCCEKRQKVGPDAAGTERDPSACSIHVNFVLGRGITFQPNISGGIMQCADHFRYIGSFADWDFTKHFL